MATNVGWKFYYQYFKNLTAVQEETENGQVKINASFEGHPNINTKKKQLTNYIHFKDYEFTVENSLPRLGSHGFELTTVYPGLLLGSGYNHEVGAKEEFILGFYFDYTTGLPVIPGSSVKGVLRSAFEEGKEYVAEEVNKILGSNIITAAEIPGLKNEIFGPDPGDPSKGSFPQQDIFYDAIPVGSFTGKLFEEDTITPHVNRRNPSLSSFTDPIPLPFLKVTTGIIYRFDFNLQDSTTVKADTKEKLFHIILQDLGIGAKTNVGYGQLILPQLWKNIYGFEDPVEQIDKNTSSNLPSPVKHEPEIPEKYHYSKTLSHGNEIVGLVIPGSKKKPEKKRICFMIGGEKVIQSSKDIQEMNPTDLVLVKINASKSGGIASFEVLRKLEQ